MENTITITNLFWPLISLLGVLLGTLWGLINKKIAKFDDRICDLEKMDSYIAEIRNDLKWIKKYLFKNK